MRQFTLTVKDDQSILVANHNPVMPMKPLDIVRTPKGALALVTETNGNGTSALITYIGGNPHGEYIAWWRQVDGLVVVDSLPNLLARSMGIKPESSDVNAAFPLPTK